MLNTLKCPLRGILEKSCLEKSRKIHRETTSLESYFSKVASCIPASLLKEGLYLRCFHTNFAKFFRSGILQNTSKQLLLYLSMEQINLFSKWTIKILDQFCFICSMVEVCCMQLSSVPINILITLPSHNETLKKTLFHRVIIFRFVILNLPVPVYIPYPIHKS